MGQFRRRLPHDYREGRALFLTWHLQGSLPHGLYPPPGKLNPGRAFVWMDRYLDTTRHGWVREESERQRIIAYIENNSVKAGLVGEPEGYP